MKGKRFAAVVFTCSCVLLAGVALRGQGEKKAKSSAPAAAARRRATVRKPGPVGTTNIHVFTDDCRSQEPMVHADAKGKVVFYNMSQTTKLTLTFTTDTVFTPHTVDIDPKDKKELTVNALPNGVNEMYTQYIINTCAPPPVTFKVKTQDARGGSDPNDITVP
jgi:hypothetical protein